jgi:riboflavin kinase/FMN adenylyltransferase
MRYPGTVRSGRGDGQKLGFPTANIPLLDFLEEGIYAGRVYVGDREYPAAIYVDTQRGLLESHLLDFEGDLYGKNIEVELLEKIRDAVAFLDESDARTTIAADVQKVREYFRVR